jgi:hypothetical protein
MLREMQVMGLDPLKKKDNNPRKTLATFAFIPQKYYSNYN